MINSAVFNTGFLIGSDNLGHKKISRDSNLDEFIWRDKFHELCTEFNLKPEEACVQF